MRDALPHLFEHTPDLLYQLVTLVSPLELQVCPLPYPNPVALPAVPQLSWSRWAARASCRRSPYPTLTLSYCLLCVYQQQQLVALVSLRESRRTAAAAVLQRPRARLRRACTRAPDALHTPRALGSSGRCVSPRFDSSMAGQRGAYKLAQGCCHWTLGLHRALALTLNSGCRRAACRCTAWCTRRAASCSPSPTRTTPASTQARAATR
jgi:hypothetical protein